MSYERVLNSLQGRSARRPRSEEWTESDDDGWTIAHWWAQHHKLDDGFPYYTLADKDGWSVAHTAASLGNLSKDFNGWKLADAKGDTVAHIAIRSGHDNGYSLKVFTPEILAYVNQQGVSVAQEIELRDQKRFTSLKEILKR